MLSYVQFNFRRDYGDINQSIKTFIQIDKPQRDKVKWIHMLKWVKNKMYNVWMLHNNNNLNGYIESAEQSRTAEHFWLAAYSASTSDNKPV